MTPKEKAKELVLKYTTVLNTLLEDEELEDKAKQCALIAVDEIINNDGLNGKCKECIKAYSKRVYDNAMNDPLLRRRMADKIRNYNQRLKQKRWKKQSI